MLSIQALKQALNHGLIFKKVHRLILFNQEPQLKPYTELVSERNYHTTKWFSEDLLSINTKKIKVKMNKPLYLGFSIS